MQWALSDTVPPGPLSPATHRQAWPGVGPCCHCERLEGARESPLRPRNAFGTVALDVSRMSRKTLVVRYRGDAQGKDGGALAYVHGEVRQSELGCLMHL